MIARIRKSRFNQLGHFIRTVEKTLLDSFYWRLSRDEFLSKLADTHTIDETVNLLWGYTGVGFYKYIFPNQNRSEITQLAQKVNAIQARVIVEIGTRSGGTLCLWSQCSEQAELIVSIDLPGGIHGGGYRHQRARLYQLFTHNRPDCQLELIRSDSQQEATRASLVELLNGRSIDFLFIDGDHRYPGVRKDYYLYRELVRPGGLIAFHDIRPNTYDESIQVFRLWDEVKASEPVVEEIIHEPYTGRYGIGLITRQ